MWRCPACLTVSGWWAIAKLLCLYYHHAAVIWIVTFLAMLALTIFIRYSVWGAPVDACAEDLKMASLLGINTDRVIALTFVIGAAMAAVAGVLLGQFYGVINPYIGFMAGMKAFTAAVLGGIGSIPGR